MATSCCAKRQRLGSCRSDHHPSGEPAHITYSLRRLPLRFGQHIARSALPRRPQQPNRNPWPACANGSRVTSTPPRFVPAPALDGGRLPTAPRCGTRSGAEQDRPYPLTHLKLGSAKRTLDFPCEFFNASTTCRMPSQRVAYGTADLAPSKAPPWPRVYSASGQKSSFEPDYNNGGCPASEGRRSLDRGHQWSILFLRQQHCVRPGPGRPTRYAACFASRSALGYYSAEAKPVLRSLRIRSPSRPSRPAGPNVDVIKDGWAASHSSL